MKIITISREFGSGGRELGKRLSDIMNFDYYDSEIITAVAKNSECDANYIEEKLNHHSLQNFPISFRNTIASTAYMQSSKVPFLLEQRKVIEGIALLGKDCIIVGRNADVILGQYKPFNIFVCATMEAKIKRCFERASENEQLTEKELIQEMKVIDKIRSQTRDILSSATWGRRDAYHLTINTSDWSIKDLTPAVADFATFWFGKRI
ncbi:cytidylate kinase-like family protein [Fusibacter ferrireducens]|uniref:Cytidylate kinase-like family protein n=1 Tax=Fusibacter ferrireducens TaxID=2785058 RepID=A0ABR9ZZF1_9FIRM|nr:cytidylate kinase-like family protein [Fusibacter ferrireducens]MBF4695538.1 cytidylate kinase-like family protein [Fusibacter ferrireducens]